VSPSPSKTAQIMALLEAKGVLRPRDLEGMGIHPRNLSNLYRQGRLARTGRGLYMLVDGTWTEHHSFAEAAKRVPGCVIGLASALRFHELTDEMPHQVWVFISRKAWKPKVDYPVLQIFRCEPDRLLDDTIQPLIEGLEVRITNVPRTVTDCFRHRRAIGLEVAILALREAIQRRLCTPAELALIAKKHRAWNLMRPYLEALL